MSKTTVIHHSADMDGIFCREIAHKFLPEAELIGWDFGDKPLELPKDGTVYVLDLPIDRPFGCEFRNGDIFKTTGDFAGFYDPKERPKDWRRFVWIDHHKSSIETHSPNIPGYRIDGVSACRLAWQWFINQIPYNADREVVACPSKQEFIDRTVSEPLAVRLAGEYDVFDKRDPDAELFQHGLRSQEITEQTWKMLLDSDCEWALKGTGMEISGSELICRSLLNQGRCLQYARAQEYREVITQQGFDLHFEGLTFLACNSHALDIRSQLFEAGIKPHHDALLGFTFHGKGYRVSLYRIPGKDADILSIAKKYGGGGHAGACGLQSSILQPFDTFQGKLYFTP